MTRSVCAVGLLALVLAAPASAETSQVLGADGAPGSNGADGDPGGAGGAGDDGETVGVTVAAVGEDNSAEATGGRGGDGGAGGDGVPSGADAGDGGDGGAGGDASAVAIVSGASSGSAIATGGLGGGGGAGGTASSPGFDGADGTAGARGDAYAEVDLDTDQLALAIGYARASGSTPESQSVVVNQGGAAESTARSFSSSGAGDASSTSAANATSGGAGDATATALGNFATATAAAQGDGGASAVAEGFLGASASASGAGSGAVSAVASVTTVAAGSGIGTANAYGESLGGGDVEVFAEVKDPSPASGGGDLVLHDAVSGSTSGQLTLTQFLFGWIEGDGDAITSLAAQNAGGGALRANVFVDSRHDGDIVLGDITATSTTGSDVELFVGADASPGGRLIHLENRDGALPTPSEIRGVSNGGAVAVDVDFEGDLAGGAAMLNVARGDTSGDLSLSQRIFTAPGTDARSTLTKTTSSDSLSLRSQAIGAFGGPAPGGGGTLPPADAHAVVDGHNDAGSVAVVGYAMGGETGGFTSARVGDAFVEARASTEGDGHDIWIGENVANGLNSGSGAQGAPGSFGLTGPAGNATSLSVGDAAGDSEVRVLDRAIGGSMETNFFGVAGAGGAASSSADASGGGVSLVSAHSRAFGGLGKGAGGTNGDGGAADANAMAIGLGAVEAWALAVGGDVSRGEDAVGSAAARAGADGASGFARAEAQTGGGPGLARVRAQSEALVGSRADVAATATTAGAFADATRSPDLHGFAFATRAPGSGDVDDALAGNAGMAAVFAGDPDAEMLSLALFEGAGRGPGEDPLELSTEIDLELGDPDLARVVFGAWDVHEQGSGFISLSFALERNGAPIGAEEIFTSASEAIAYFTDRAIDLGALASGDVVRAVFELTIASDAVFGMRLGFASSVPEPGTGVLLAVGIAALAARRRVIASE